MIDKPVFREYPLSRTCAARDGLDGRHVGLYVFVMTEKEVLFGAVLTVGHHGFYRHIGILFMPLDERAHFVSVVDGAGGYLHGGNDFMEPIDRPVSLVPELCLTSAVADNGGVGVSSGDIATVHAFGPSGVNFSLCGLLYDRGIGGGFGPGGFRH